MSGQLSLLQNVIDDFDRWREERIREIAKNQRKDGQKENFMKRVTDRNQKRVY